TRGLFLSSFSCSCSNSCSKEQEQEQENKSHLNLPVGSFAFSPDSCEGSLASVESELGKIRTCFSGAPMAFVHARSEAPIDFDVIFASLQQHCPGTELLDGDYGGSRIARLVEISRVLGESENNPVIARALETTRKLGQTRRIRVPLSDGAELI